MRLFIGGQHAILQSLLRCAGISCASHIKHDGEVLCGLALLDQLLMSQAGNEERECSLAASLPNEAGADRAVCAELAKRGSDFGGA